MSKAPELDLILERLAKIENTLESFEDSLSETLREIVSKFDMIVDLHMGRGPA